MNGMFFNCSSLTSLDLSNFNTSNVTNMADMFYNCSSLTSLNLSNFDTSKVIYMNGMFFNCSSLTSLNLSNFDTSKVIYMNGMFYNCSSLTSLNLSNFDTSKVEEMTVMFAGCSQLPSLDLSNFNTSKVRFMESMFWGCSQLKFINLINFTEKSILHVFNIFYDVPDNVIVCLDINNIKILNELKKYANYTLNCSYVFETKETEIVTETEISKIETEFIITNQIKNVIENIKKYQPKFKTKEEENKFYDEILKNIKEVFTSENYVLSDLENGKEEKIETEKMTITITTTENQKNNINGNTTVVDLGNCENQLKKVYNLSNESMLYMIKFDVKQEEMQIPKIEYELYSKLKGNNLEKLSLSSCQNIKINLIIPIKVKDSLDKLNSKSDYYNDICYLAKSAKGTDLSLKVRKQEYANKTVCQDGCDLNDYNYILANCSCDVQEASKSFAHININKEKLLANIKDVKNIANVKMLACTKNLFSKIGILTNIGFFIIISIVLFRVITLFVFYIKQSDLLEKKIKDITYAIKNYNLMNKEEVKESKWNKKNKKEKVNEKDKNNNSFNEKENNNIIINTFKEANIKKDEVKHNKRRSKKKSRTFKKLKEININENNNNNIIIPNNNNDNNILTINKKKKRNKKRNYSIQSQSISKLVDEKKIEKVIKIFEANDDELNNLPYELALEIDNRSYCEYYISLLRTKHALIFTFWYKADYNSRILKIDLLFIIFASNYAVNALFFNDDTMYNIYQKEGEFDIEYELTKICYTFLISTFLEMVVKKLALSNNDIISFKQDKNKNNVNKRENRLRKILAIKSIFYFIISSIFLLFFWYYISMFGAVYPNTQLYLLKDTLLSFGGTLIKPFFINLLPGFFRIPALANRRKNRKFLYYLSRIIQIF